MLFLSNPQNQRIPLHERIISGRIFGEHVHPTTQALFPERNAIFQDDNASMYTAKIVKECHEKHSKDVEHLDCLARSLQVVITGHLWPVLVIQVNVDSHCHRLKSPRLF